MLRAHRGRKLYARNDIAARKIRLFEITIGLWRADVWTVLRPLGVLTAAPSRIHKS